VRNLKTKIAVIGTGSWGTALAQVLADNGHAPILYGIDPGEVCDINDCCRNSKYFGDLELSSTLCATTSLEQAITDACAVVLAVPSKFIYQVTSEIAPLLAHDAIIVNTAKGFDRERRCRLSDAIRLALAESGREAPITSLLGPSHAEEVIQRMKTSISVASTDTESAKIVQNLFSNGYLRVYVTDDEIGAEYGAAVKNVIAISAGIAEGQGYGDNAKAALVTRGLAEMIRYGCAKGAQKDTFFGLSGLGDLVVTCFSPHSRNYRAGLEIGRANDAKKWLESCQGTIEGVESCRAIVHDLQQHDFEMPLVQSLYRVLFEGNSPTEEITTLLERKLKSE